jgi:hypothetical protein
MTSKVKKEKGIDPDTGRMIYEVIHLTKQQEVLYDLLLRIAEKVNA